MAGASKDEDRHLAAADLCADQQLSAADAPPYRTGCNKLNLRERSARPLPFQCEARAAIMSGPNSARHSVRGSSDLAFRATFRPDVRDFLIRGSQKVIVHYERLLSTAKSEEERQLYQSRIEREQRVIDDLRKGALPERFAA